MPLLMLFGYTGVQNILEKMTLKRLTKAIQPIADAPADFYVGLQEGWM
jgi:hypothetical protein